MRNLIYLLLCIIALNSTLYTQTFTYTNAPPVIDGVMDNSWNNYTPVSISNRIMTIDSDADLNANFRGCWDDYNLYLFITVNDDVLNSDFGSVWLDDGTEILIDVNNDDLTSMGATDYKYQFRYSDNTIRETNGATTNVAMGQTETAGSVMYEVKIPWSTILQSNPDNGVALGMDIHINDNDGSSRDGKLAWTITDDSDTHNPSSYGTITLGGKALLGTTPAPSFSHERGFYDAKFYMTITANSPDETITYTLDGSDPRTSSNSLTATGSVDVYIDPTTATNRRGETPGVVVRACTSKDGYQSSDVITHTYLFIYRIEGQIQPYGDWPRANTAYWDWDADQYMYYNMNSYIANHSTYGPLLDDALLDIPTVSISTSVDNLFDDNTGIYENANSEGGDWERPASIEIFNNADGKPDLQIDAGLRIRGGASRIPFNPKHSFRVFFRGEYGETKLNYPLFDDEGADTFDKIDFRTAQNYAWQSDGNSPSQNTMLKEVFFRDLQGKMGHPYTRSRYYHLYLNGMYWGIYMTQERSEARYAETYMGGDKDDYDVVKPERDLPDYNGDDLKVVATDGTMDAYGRLYAKTQAGFASDAAYFEVQGMNTDGSRNSSYERLLDIENFIDYIALIFYSGSYDAPLGNWSGTDQKGNNYFAIYNRNNPDGFKWFVHDFEHTMNGKTSHAYDDGLYEDWVIKDVVYENFPSGVEWFNPLMIHLQMMKNDEYKIKFADRVFKYFTEGGLLTPDSVLAVWNNRQSQIETAIIAESARWGDTKRDDNTKADWLWIINYLKNNYFPDRTAFVLNSIKDIGLYPDINPPTVTKSGESSQILSEAYSLSIGDYVRIENSNGSQGTIYYTTDGSDPRAIGGNINASATNGNDLADVSISTTTILKARILDGTTWSAVKEIEFRVADPISGLRVTEVAYNPADKGLVSGGDLEFIELKNTGAETINLTGVQFTDGIAYTFGTKSLAAGEFVVLASNMTAFYNEYGFYPDGQYTGGLKNSGEQVTIQNAVGTVIIDFTYNDKDPWPTSADGLGNTLVSAEDNPSGDPNDASYWQASTVAGGSPYADDPNNVFAPVIISEILSHTDYPVMDAIELYNPTDSTVNIGNWLLSDDKDLPSKYQIPAGTTIPAKSYITFYEGHYTGEVLSSGSDEFGSGFSLSSHGEELYLIAASADKSPVGYSTMVSFGEIENNVSFGTYTNSVNNVHFVAQESKSLGSENIYPRVGPLVFSQVMYHPDALNYEYIEITNISDFEVDLWASDNTANTWKISGAGFTFPENISLEKDSSLYVIQAGVTAADFRAKYNLSANTQVFNMTGVLNDLGETLTLKKPAPEYIDDIFYVFEYITIDELTYANTAPWDISAAGNGTALVRIDNSAYGNDPVNWNDGSLTVPALIADNSFNYAGQDITITFFDNPEWRSNITDVRINDVAVDNAKLQIAAGSIVIDGSLFAYANDYEITVNSASYDPTSVTQTILPDQDAMVLSADSDNNYEGYNMTLTFTDNVTWRNSVTAVYVNASAVDAGDYTLENGTLTIDGSLFPTADNYTVTVEANTYENSQVTQEALALQTPPVLAADADDNYILENVAVTFTDIADWRSNISEITVDGEVVAPVNMQVVADTVYIDASLFATAKDYAVVINATGYTSTQVSQTIKAYETAPALTADSENNYIGEDMTIKFADNADWRNAVSSVSVNAVTIDAADYAFANGELIISGNNFASAANYTVIVEAEYYEATQVVQQAVALEIPPALIADADNNYVGFEMEISFADDTDWRSAVTNVTLNNVALDAADYTLESGKLTIAESLFAPVNDYTIAIEAEYYSTTQVVQTAIALQTPVTLVADDSGNYPGEDISVTFASNADWRTNITQVTIDGSVVDAQDMQITSGSIVFDGTLFTTGNDYEIIISSSTYTNASLTQTVNPLKTAPVLNASSTYETFDVEITFTDDEAWRNAVIIVKVNDDKLDTPDYRFEAGKLTIKSDIFITENNTVSIEAEWYEITSVTQIILPLKDAPTLIADSENNYVGYDIEITFTDNADWRGEVNAVKIDGVEVIPAGYYLNSGTLIIKGSMFPDVANYTITVETENFRVAEVIQPVTDLQGTPALSSDITNNYINEDVAITFEDNADWRRNITQITIDGDVVDLSDIAIAEGTIIIDGSLLPAGKDYTINIAATGFNTVELTQNVKSYNVAPELTADSDNNYVGYDMEITFADNAEWITAVTAVTLNSSTVDAANYTLADGKLIIAGSLFLDADSYTVAVEADFYNTVQVTQTAIALQTPVTLVVDATDNYTGENINITFADNADWRSNISGITINGVLVDESDYTLTAGSLVFDASVFASANDYEIVASATGYSNVSLTQTVNAYEVAPELTADTESNYTGQDAVITFTDNADWRNAVSGVFINAAELGAAHYSFDAGTLTIAGSQLSTPANYTISVEADFYNSVQVVQQAKAFMTPPAMVADADNNFTGFDMEITFADNADWRTAVTKVLFNSVEMSTSDYTLEAGTLSINGDMFSDLLNDTISVEAEFYNQAQVIQITKAFQTAPVLVADISDNYVNEDVTLTFTDNVNWRSNITSVTIGGAVVGSENIQINTGEIVLDGSLFANADNYAISISATGYTNAQATQSVKAYETAPVLTADSDGNNAGNDIEIEFTADSDWSNAITGIFIDNNKLTALDYTIGESIITLMSSLFPALNDYTVRVEAEFYSSTQVVQSVTGIAPVLFAETDTSYTSNSVVFNFADNSSWRSAVTAIYVNNTVVNSGDYTLESGKLTLSERLFATAANYDVRIEALRYNNVEAVAIVSDSKESPELTAAAAKNFIGQAVTYTFSDNADWRNSITSLKINGTTLSSGFYTLTAGTLTLDGNIFQTVGNYTLSIEADHFEYVERIFAVEDIESNAPVEEVISANIYPNPSAGVFRISLPQLSGELRYKVLNLQGQVILQGISLENEFTIDMTNAHSATYLLVITSEYGTYTDRLMKE